MEENRDKLKTNHTFVICAYKENEFLEQCVKSVAEQRVSSNYLISTSTPNKHIYDIAEKYGACVFINENENAGMQDNWNFAVSQAKTDFVTVCHQDDYYDLTYFQSIQPFLCEDVIMIHSAYLDVLDGEFNRSLNNKIKTALQKRIKNENRQRSKFYKKLVLSFGNSICCPSCTYNVAKLGQPIFTSNLKHACDWDLFIDLAEKEGRVVYVFNPVTYKRIHKLSATSDDIASGLRAKEDLILFKRLWPKPLAHFFADLIKYIYKFS